MKSEFQNALKAISSSQTPDEIVQRLRKELRVAIPCDRLGLAFVHADGQTLVMGPVHSSHRVLLATGHRESLEGSVLGEILHREKPRIVKHEVEPGRGALQLIAREGFKESLLIPLLINGKPLGLLWFSSRRARAYSREHECAVELIAGQLAAVFERARLASRATVDGQIKARLLQENTGLRELIGGAAAAPLAGESVPWKKTLQRVELVAKTDSTVLIRGETGTGKELIARAIHRLSPRANKPFIALNCGAFSPELIASELFGHERGAFTGAIERRLGRIELAYGGTLFLDEIAEMSPETQIKFLRVLQEREFERVGGTQIIRADIRVIAATHRNLELERKAGRFRDDLFYRLNVFPINVPPLRERKEDIAPLIAVFARRFGQKMNKTIESVNPQSLEQCLYYHWPGNVRELENLVERSVILAESPILSFDPLPEAGTAASGNSLALSEVIKAHLIKVLRTTRGRIYGKNGAARILRLKPSTLQAKLKKHGIDRLKVVPEKYSYGTKRAI